MTTEPFTVECSVLIASQVDRALGKELQGATPSADALAVSLDAAQASGRYVTAQRRVTALLKATSGRDLDMVWYENSLDKSFKFWRFMRIPEKTFID